MCGLLFTTCLFTGNSQISRSSCCQPSTTRLEGHLPLTRLFSHREQWVASGNVFSRSRHICSRSHPRARARAVMLAGQLRQWEDTPGKRIKAPPTIWPIDTVWPEAKRCHGGGNCVNGERSRTRRRHLVHRRKWRVEKWARKYREPELSLHEHILRKMHIWKSFP